MWPGWYGQEMAAKARSWDSKDGAKVLVPGPGHGECYTYRLGKGRERRAWERGPVQRLFDFTEVHSQQN